MAANEQPRWNKKTRGGKTPSITRRTFLGGTAAAASVAAAPWVVPSSALGADGATAPSERIGVGLIGRGAMGGGHLRRMLNEPTVQLLGVCEVDRVRRKLLDAPVPVLAERRHPGTDDVGVRHCVDLNSVRR